MTKRLTPRQLRHQNALALDLMRRASGKTGPASLEAFVNANKAEALAPRKERAKPRLIEAGILREIIKALKADPRVGFVMRLNAGTIRGDGSFIQLAPRGMPDVFGIIKRGGPSNPDAWAHRGNAFFIEVKAPGKKPEPHQQEMLDRLRSYGCVAGWCDSVQGALDLLP